MTHAESLALLHKLAMSERVGWTGGRGFAIMVPDAILTAQSHGAAAVRAIRRTFDPHYSAYDENAYSIEESRLAFRAALDAVGIKGAL